MISLFQTLVTHQKETGSFKQRMVDKFGYKETNLVHVGGFDSMENFKELELYVVVYIPRLQELDYEFCGKTYYGGQKQIIKYINNLFAKQNLPLPSFESKPESEVEPPTREQLAGFFRN